MKTSERDSPANLGRVHPDPVEEVERALEQRASRNGQLQAPSSRAREPETSANLMSPRLAAGSPLAAESLLLGLRDVHPLQVEREAHRGQAPAEPPHQLVVAPAAAEDVAKRRVVDLDDRARVVAQVTEQAEVELNSLGHPAAASAS